MFLKFFFNYLSTQKKIEWLKRKGFMLGTRNRGGRTIYIYMLTNLFVEVIFKNDDAEQAPEALTTLSGLKHLNEYLEKEFKATF